MLSQMARFYYFLWLDSIAVGVGGAGASLSIHPQLGCFWILALENNVAMNMEVHKSF